ncbi:MAG: hypothetical protein KBD62_32240 [Kofleriaceae bacterium]|nr:hypothetical protein [Kofleriaceae bacterium]
MSSVPFRNWTTDGWIEGDPISRYSPQPRPAPRVLSWRWVVDEECCCGSGIVHSIEPGTEHMMPPGEIESYCTCEAGKWRTVRDGTHGLVGFEEAA